MKQEIPDAEPQVTAADCATGKKSLSALHALFLVYETRNALLPSLPDKGDKGFIGVGAVNAKHQLKYCSSSLKPPGSTFWV